jgi:predicted ATP-dependent protease
MAIETLNPQQLRSVTDDSIFDISSSDELTPAKPCIGQDRAVAALQTALAVPGPGYHVMVTGREGTERLNCLYSVLNDFASSKVKLENPDRVLLPVRGRVSQYDEVQLQNGYAQKLINACQQVVMATINNDAEYQTRLMLELRSGFSELPLLSEYINWLDDFSLLLLAGENSEFEYRELQQMVPLFLQAGCKDCMPIISDQFTDIASLLGTLSTDSETGRKIINAGSLIQASGGFLIIDGRRMSEDLQLWRILRDILKSGLIPLQAFSSISSPQGGGSLPLKGNIRLACRVILLCDSSVFEQFQALEADLGFLFPVIAEFESEMERNDENTFVAARIISALIKQYRCLPLNKQALATVVDTATRLSGTRDHITLSRSSLSRTLREASLLANFGGEEIITRKHIKMVIQQSRQRVLSERRDATQSIINGETQIELTGKVVGQINGLTMVGIGEQSYLEPSRVTATVRAGDGAVVDIEREVNLGGSIHSKGVLILTSLLAARYSRHIPLSLIASLVFEQSYAYVDGDSASAAEMMAILSAITEIPIMQNIAITGSIDQRGQILCVGDINNKIEGYYRLCHHHGELADAGVVIPKTNLRDLMLDDDVVQAVTDGRFAIYAVSTLDDVIELFTGMDSGKEDDKHKFPAGSFNALVQDSLKQFAEENKHDHKDD